MKFFFSPSLGSCHPDFPSQLQPDDIEITKALYDDFVAQSANGATMSLNGLGEPEIVPEPPKPIAYWIQIKINEINAAVELAIESGFISNALGADHTYKSDRDDQLNLIGAAQAGVDMPFYCADTTDDWQYRLHTAAQLQTVLTDGAAIKLAFLQQARTLKAQAEAATTEAELDAIVVVF